MDSRLACLLVVLGLITSGSLECRRRHFYAPVFVPQPLDQASPLPDIGTPHPLILKAASPLGRWVVYCQARKDSDEDGEVFVDVDNHGWPLGDDVVMYYAALGQREKRWERLIAVDPKGRFLLAVADNETLILVDSSSHAEVELSGVPLRESPIRSAGSFSPDGTHLLYIRVRIGGYQGYFSDAPTHEAVIRNLQTGAEHVLDHGPGLLSKASFSKNGRWVLAEVVERDTDGNGRPELPEVWTTLAHSPCRGPAASYSMGWALGDEPSLRIVGTNHGKAVYVPGFMTHVGDRVLRMADNGCLALLHPEGPEEVLPEPCCREEVKAIDDEHEAFVTTCTEGPSSGLAILRRGTEVTPFPAGYDDINRVGHFVVIYQTKEDSFLVNLATSEFTPFADLGTPFAAHESTLLLRYNHSLNIVDTSSNQRTILPIEMNFFSTWMQRGEKVVIVDGRGATWVIDLRTKLVGRLETVPLAVTGEGLVLTAAWNEPDRWRREVPTGPMRWLAARIGSPTAGE